MRLKIILKAEKLPILYRHRFMALIKEALQIINEDYKKKLYPSKDSEKSKITKPFCFSVVFPTNKIIKKEKMIIDENFEVEGTFYCPEMIIRTLF